MAISAYERKIFQRSEDLMFDMGISYERATVGTLNGKRAVCLLLDRFTKKEEIDELIQKLQKSFRKAEVVRGQGLIVNTLQRSSTRTSTSSSTRKKKLRLPLTTEEEVETDFSRCNATANLCNCGICKSNNPALVCSSA